jgi:histidinol-phosphatase (PHP family)
MMVSAVPGDGHVHSEWSWDARRGSMERSCVRALELGLPSIAFTEHLDHTVWTVALEDLSPDDHLAALAGPEGLLTPPVLDAKAYLQGIGRCRERFPGLRILSGLEIGEPHRHVEAVASVMACGEFDRVLGSLHCLPDGEGFAEPPGLYRHRAAHEVVREYLVEIAELVSRSHVFTVLAHIDYPVRYWPEHAGPFDPGDFEDEFRYALHALAGSDRALELNTTGRPYPQILRWWREEGGTALTFGSDAHDPVAVARGFTEAVDLAEACGFRSGRRSHDPWTCTAR